MTHVDTRMTIGGIDVDGWDAVEGRPRVSTMPYLYDIAEGNVSGHVPFSKLGYNADVGATEEDIITQGGTYPWLTDGTTITVQSSNAADTLAGTGIQKLRISYLDNTYTAGSQIIDMAGTAAGTLTATNILRINSIRAYQVGSYGMAVGTITATAGGVTYRQIEPGYSRGRSLAHTVPLGKTLFITSIAVSSGYTTAGKVVRWTARAQVDDNDPSTKINFFMPFFEIQTQDASFFREFEIPIKIPATADIKVSAVSNGAGSFASCALRGWLEDND